jgi:HEAT repeat protein
MRSKASAVRELAVRTLGRIGPDAREVVSVLRQALQDRHPPTRAQAALALWRVTTDADAIVPSVVLLLASRNPAVRTTLGDLLRELDPGTLAVLGQRVKDHPHTALRTAAFESLRQIGPDALTPRLE